MRRGGFDEGKEEKISRLVTLCRKRVEMPKRFVDPALFGPWCLVLLIWQLGAVAIAQTEPKVDLSEKNILVIHAFESNIPVFLGTDKGLANTLESVGVFSLNQYFESLDLRRNPGPEHRKLVVEQMRVRYGRRRLDMIITMYPEALEFVLKDCRDFLPDVPILALYLPLGMELPKTDRRIIGHSASPDVIGTLEIALKLVPNAKHVYVVCGAHPVDKRLEDQARSGLKKWEDRLEIHYLSHMPFEDMLDTVFRMPPGSIVLVLPFSRDVAGKIHTSPEVVRRLSQVSAGPIFGILDPMLGKGITGGSLINFEFIGSKAGELTLDILGGAKIPDDIPAFLEVPHVPMFDWRELRRWKLNEAALPKGSIVVNRDSTFWDFKYYILGGLGFCVLQSFLIAGLLLQRHRKIVAEESLRKKSEELDQFFNVTLDLLCIANTDGYFLRLNPTCEKLLGYTREELTAKRFLDFVHPDDVDDTLKAISALASQKRIYSFENRYRCKDGTYRWLEWSSSPSGNLIFAAARDVSERKRADEALSKNRRLLAEVERIGQVGGSEIDLNTMKRTWTAEMYNIHEVDPAFEPTAENILQFYTPASRPIFEKVMRRAIDHGEPFDLELEITTAKGNRRDVHVMGRADLENHRVLVCLQDITTRKQRELDMAELRLERNHMARVLTVNELSTTLAHEINQPLGAILNNAEAARILLSRPLDKREAIPEIVDDIIQDAKRAGDVIRKVRSVLKKADPQFELLPVNALVDEALVIVQNYLALNDVTLHLDLTPDLADIRGNRVRLQQVLINLMTNALDAMNVTPTRILTVRTAMDAPDMVIMSVSDSGPGIPEARRETVFQPFVTTKKNGLGLGLSICRSIVEEHGGRIWAHDNAGGGATFSFTLKTWGEASA
jgi:PAS domain S-box-containing protein